MKRARRQATFASLHVVRSPGPSMIFDDTLEAHSQRLGCMPCFILETRPERPAALVEEALNRGSPIEIGDGIGDDPGLPADYRDGRILF